MKRYEELAAQQLVSINDRDKFRTTQASAQASVQQSQAQIRIAEETLVSTQVARKSLEAQVESAQAQLELARIDLANTVIHAPRDGQISESQRTRGPVRRCRFAAAVPWYLTRCGWWPNYKEGQTWGMAIGQPATFSVDAFQGQVLRGRVQEIAPATGSEFTACCARTMPAATSPRWCSGCRCGYRSTGIRSWQSSCGRHVGDRAGGYPVQADGLGRRPCRTV